MGITRYVPREIVKYGAPIALATTLIFSGCATNKNNTERTFPSHDNRTYQNLSQKKEQKEDYEPEKKFFGNAIGAFIGEGLIRLLIP